jgi:hypothetical protein
MILRVWRPRAIMIQQSLHAYTRVENLDRVLAEAACSPAWASLSTARASVRCCILPPPLIGTSLGSCKKAVCDLHHGCRSTKIGPPSAAKRSCLLLPTAGKVHPQGSNTKRAYSQTTGVVRFLCWWADAPRAHGAPRVQVKRRSAVPLIEARGASPAESTSPD